MHMQRREMLKTGLAGAALFVPTAGDPVAFAGSPGTGASAHAPATPLTSRGVDFCTAAAEGRIEALKSMLVEDPALLYARDAKGQSAFLLACLAQKAAAAEFLLSQGLVLDIHEAVAAGKEERAKELLAIAPGLIHLPNAFGDTPMHLAALCEQTGMIAQIAWGPRFDAANPKRGSLTPAHLAVLASDPGKALSMAQSIFGNWINPNLKADDGNTPLHFAAQMGHEEVAKLLVRKGADTAAKNSAGKTALDVAFEQKRDGVTRLLRNSSAIRIDHEVRRYTATRDGSAFRLAQPDLPQSWINEFVIAAHFNFERVKQMLARSSDLLNANPTWNELAVEAAGHMGNETICGFLLDRGAPYSLCTAAMFGDTATAKKYLAEDPARVRERGAHDFPLLWYPIFGKEHVETAELLIAGGADIRDGIRGVTALHVAAQRGQAKMAELLVAKGADPAERAPHASGAMLTAAEFAENAKHGELAAFLRAREKPLK
jgi:ankyrin repeat protein